MNSTQNEAPVIAVEHLSRRFESKQALDDVTLELPRGVVLGLVGANGAGKTTLIKHILGLLRARQGSVRVFGMDPVKQSVAVLGRLGYLSEDRDLPPWMTVQQLIGYCRAFRPSWDDAYAESLRRQFQLSPASVVRTLSKGELAKAGLLVALAYRPELLVLDEPSSGLDPVVRKELLEAVVRSVVAEGRTVLLSSHLLEEIARVSDRVAMVCKGRIVLNGALHDILESHRRLVIRLPDKAAKPSLLPGALSITGGPAEWTVITNGEIESLRSALRQARGEVLEESNATLEEIFHSRVANGAAGAATVN